MQNVFKLFHTLIKSVGRVKQLQHLKTFELNFILTLKLFLNLFFYAYSQNLVVAWSGPCKLNNTL